LSVVLRQISGLAAFFQTGFWLGFGTFHVATRRQALVAQYAQGFDFGALAGAAKFQHLEIARARLAVLVNDFFFLGLGAPKHQQLADVLNRRCIEFVRQGLEHLFAGGAVIRENTHFDQAMGVERRIDFFFDVGRQAIAAHHDHGVQVVGFSAVILALSGS